MNIQPKTIEFSIYHPGERMAGIRAFEDNIKIIIESGDPGGEPGEFEKYIQKFLKEWYDAEVVQEK